MSEKRIISSFLNYCDSVLLTLILKEITVLITFDFNKSLQTMS